MRFVVIAAQRTGSSHLVNILTGHPDVFCHGNVFAGSIMPVYWPPKKRMPRQKKKEFREELMKVRRSDPAAFLQAVFALDHDRPSVGFKIFPGQNDSVLEAVIRMQSVRKILLFRRNVLANYASSKAAKKAGTWGTQTQEEVPAGEKVLFKEAAFLDHWSKYMDGYRTIMRNIIDASTEFFLVYYEDLNDELVRAGLLNFIGADARKSIVADDQIKQQIKLHSNDIVGRFTNPAAVRNYLETNDLRHWEYEGEGSFRTRPALRQSE